ncbi:MAG: alpha/beta fold hydrolase [Candidatus Nanohaloarchaea archaeon]|nr:alpha/beta fold hydrolase [Candidatus Nanohaloarchaea archaeon]
MDPFTYGLKVQQEFYERSMDTMSEMGVLPDYLDTMHSAEVGVTESEEVFREHSVSLKHYPSDAEEETPLLVVPSMVNEDYILDLHEGKSVIGTLQEEGHDVYMLDWGEPDRMEQSRKLGDYINRYLDDAVDAARERSDSETVNILGYCMGGTMSAIYTSFHQDKVENLGLMASAFELDGTGGEVEEMGEYVDPEQLVDFYGNMPGELLDFGFQARDPVDNYVSKYFDLWDNRDDEEFVEFFGSMEQWLNDPKDVPGEAYRKFVEDIYQENKLMEDRMHVATDGRRKERVELGEIDVPVLQILGEYDDLVPPEASRPLNEKVASEDTEIMEAGTGHVGLSVSGKTHAELWPEVAQWFSERS